MAVIVESASLVQNGLSGVTSITLAAFNPTGLTRFVIIGICMFLDNNTVASITRVGDAPVFIGRISNGAEAQLTTEFWKILAPVTGAVDVVVNLTLSDDVAAFVLNFNGVNQTTPHDTIQTNVGTGAPSITVTSQTNDFVVDCVGSTEGGLVVGGGQTHQMNQAPADLEGDSSTQTGDASVVMNWTPATVHAHVAININEVGAPPPPAGQAESGTIGNMIFGLLFGLMNLVTFYNRLFE